MWSNEWATEQAIKKNNAAVTAGGPGILLSYTPRTDIESDDYSAFDLSFGWNITDKVSLRGGITNLFDTDPVVVGSQTGYSVNGTPTTQVCSSLGNQPGCANPFNYGVSPPGPVTGSGNFGTYYDTLGRQFFVGMSMHF